MPRTDDHQISRQILRLHPELDSQQLRFIGHDDEPMLAVAGPGSGKTKCVELRTLNLLLNGSAQPEELVVTTFSKPATQELRRRVEASASASGYRGDISPVRISTIHGLCHQILKPRAPEVGLKFGYRILAPPQQALLMQDEFGTIFGPDLPVLSKRGRKEQQDIVEQAMAYFDRICEERIEIEDMADSSSAFDAALARCCWRYRRALSESNSVDFAQLQNHVGDLLDDDQIAQRLGASIRFLMVDEAQDISRVQDRILRKLSEVHGNIAMVGDDDQAIYGFRGGSVQNILTFPDHYPGCDVVALNTNYRSHATIVGMYNRWMAKANWTGPDGQTMYRYEKDIVARSPEAHPDYQAVIAIGGTSLYDEGRQLGELMRFLKLNGVVTRYGQCALLLHSVNPDISTPYIDGLEDAGVPARCVPAGAVHRSGQHRQDAEVTVTTIHQAKGVEWDVVAVGSLSAAGRDLDPKGRRLARYLPSRSPWNGGQASEHDRMRLHYVAFSRPRHLLVLTASEAPHRRFKPIWDHIPRWPDVDLHALGNQRFGAEPPDLVVDFGRLKSMSFRMIAPGRR